MAQRTATEERTTTDHDEIMAWAEERGGTPAKVKNTASEEGGILRIDFGEKDDSLEPIEWADFFAIFEDRNLAFVCQDETKDGKISRFFKFVKRAE